MPKWPQIQTEFGKNEIPSWSHEGHGSGKEHVQKKCLQIWGKPKFHKPGNKNSSDLWLEFRQFSPAAKPSVHPTPEVAICGARPAL